MSKISKELKITIEEVRDRGLIWRGNHIPYNPNNVEKARILRRNQTPAERKLWKDFLSKHRLRFLRQRPLDHYIVDFYCASKKLVIEIDGDSHFTDNGKENDKIRSELLNFYGVKVIRFSNEDIFRDFNRVCDRIETEL